MLYNVAIYIYVAITDVFEHACIYNSCVAYVHMICT